MARGNNPDNATAGKKRIGHRCAIIDSFVAWDVRKTLGRSRYIQILFFRPIPTVFYPISNTILLYFPFR